MFGEHINQLLSVKSSGVSNNANLFTSARCARERGKLKAPFPLNTLNPNSNRAFASSWPKIYLTDCYLFLET